MLNLLLGWLLIPWVVALVWAYSRNETAELLKQQQVVGSNGRGRDSLAATMLPANSSKSGANENGGTSSEIERLLALKERGVISQEEFDAGKKKLLGLQ